MNKVNDMGELNKYKYVWKARIFDQMSMFMY